MITCFFFAYLSGLMRATTSMVVGTLFASVALFAIGMSTAGWIAVGAIGIFSIGEMLSSPKFSEFIGNFAPRDKKAMYLGFSQLPLAIGWTLEGKLGPKLYDHYASKDNFSRDLLTEKIEQGQASMPSGEALAEWAEQLGRPVESLTEVAPSNLQAFIDHIPQGEAFDWLVRMTGGDPIALTQTLYDSHNVGMVWYIMGGIGILSAIGIWIYGKWILTLKSMD
jgi:hypothetical protein